MGRTSNYDTFFILQRVVIKILGDLQLGSRISSILPNEEEGACILGWGVREHSGSSGCMLSFSMLWSLWGQH